MKVLLLELKHADLQRDPLAHHGLQGLQSPASFLQSCLLILWGDIFLCPFCLWQALSRRKLAGMTVQRTQIRQVQKNPQPGEIKDKASGGTLSAHSHQDPVMSANITRMSSEELSGELRETLGWPQVSPASAGDMGPGQLVGARQLLPWSFSVGASNKVPGLLKLTS